MARTDTNRPVGRDPPTPLGNPRDLYLRWAIDTKFAYMFQRNKSVGLLIQWISPKEAALAKRFIPAGAHVPDVYLVPGAKTGLVPVFWAMTLPVASVQQFTKSVAKLATTIELAAPVTGASGNVVQNLAPTRSASETLLAVLDDGCAFANERFRTPAGTRILWLWNQDIGAQGGLLNGTLPSANANFGYGGQWSSADLDGFFPPIGGTQEEAYQRAGLPGLHRSAAHGTHVMDLLAGERPNTANLRDIVFVQFPKEGIDDPSGVWLTQYAAHGLSYITECAGPNTKTIVANISWGPQTGPHDGKSVLETFIEQLIQDQWDNHGRKLIVTLACGNSFGARAHACVSYTAGGSFDWIVPPDGEIPTFIELWWPKAVTPAGVRLRVQPPGGPSAAVSVGPPTSPDGTWSASIGQIGGWTTALLVVHPTGGKQAPHGPHGRWRIEIDASVGGAAGDIDVYVARADHNMGARRRAKASYLTDAALERQRFGPPADRFKEAPLSSIRRAGTFSGIATGLRTKVAAGYTLRTEEPAPYSSSGPTRGPRLHPDYAFATERSQARTGVWAAGVRTGTKVRLSGTSTAAPQFGRVLSNVYVPKPPQRPDPERTGLGEVAPSPEVIGPE